MELKRTEEMDKIDCIERGIDGKKLEFHFPNLNCDSIDGLFTYTRNDLKTIIEEKMQSQLKQVSLSCSTSVIYMISFNQTKLQHMIFYSRKCGIKNNQDINDAIDSLKRNLIAKTLLFSNPNDDSPYYVMKNIESVKFILHGIKL